VKTQEFVTRFSPEAIEAGRLYHIHPLVMLAQAAMESAWGESRLAKVHHNMFGITAYGTSNEYWHGCRVELRNGGLKFRKYGDTRHSFLDYARLIRTCYPVAADLSAHPESFAKEIAYSRYISESNGDNREAYRKAIVRISRQITRNGGLEGYR